MTKFDAELGEFIWNEVNNVFDMLPLAAVVDNKIFCVHGGVPSLSVNPSNTLEPINRIPCPLSDPEGQAPLAWEILWNDPLWYVINCSIYLQKLIY